MKTIFTFLLLLILINNVYSQLSINISFEDTTYHPYLKKDTSISNNIWQIGAPKKTVFNSGRLSKNAILTDTVNYYPKNNYSEFEILIPSNAINNVDETTLSFYYKLDTDSLLDGGTIDVSYDGRKTWQNLVTDTTYTNTPGLLGATNNLISSLGKPGYSGRSIRESVSEEWSYSFYNWSWYNQSHGENSKLRPDSIILRFIFSSDDIETNKEGWVIDDINLGYNFVGINELGEGHSFSIYPNPTSDFIRISSRDYSPFSYWVYDMLGNKIIEMPTVSITETSINMQALPNGIYFIKILNKNKISNYKFIKI